MQEGHQIFTGLAHWIKGGIFFLFGIVTLGRWAGSFGDLGWVSLFRHVWAQDDVSLTFLRRRGIFDRRHQTTHGAHRLSLLRVRSSSRTAQPTFSWNTSAMPVASTAPKILNTSR